MCGVIITKQNINIIQIIRTVLPTLRGKNNWIDIQIKTKILSPVLSLVE